MKRLKNHSYGVIYADDRSRRRTDVIWTIIAALFAIAMFVVANLKWNRDKFNTIYQKSYTESAYYLCDQNLKQLFIVDPNLSENATRWVDICPDRFVKFMCLCVPTDPQKRDQYLDEFIQSNAQSPYLLNVMSGRKFFKVILYTIIIGLSLGLMNIPVVFCWPRFSAKLSFIFCLLLLLAVGILLLLLYDHFWSKFNLLKIIVTIICFFLCILIISMIWLYANQIKLYGIFLDYAVKFLNHNLSTFLYIPLFLLFAVGFVVLIAWQHICFKSDNSDPKKNPFDMSLGLFGILNIIQLVWGIQFLRDAFNFCVSGNFVDWFFKNKKGCYGSFNRLVCLNWGSVVAGSFINAFFQIPNLIYELLRCHPNTCCNRAGNKCYNSCDCCFLLFDLIRTDTYSYINISGENLCTSSQYCRELCNNNEMFVGMQSPMKHYRLMMHLTDISAAFLISWFIQRYLMEYYGIWNNIMVIIISLLCVTFFISIFSDTAQAAQTCFLCERQIQNDYTQMKGVDNQFRDDLLHHEKRMRKDGAC